jgi:CheY-like chemotaxis protein
MRPAPELWVCGDPVRLAQVLVNLLNNAARYTPAGGEIRLETEADAQQARVSVVDNGIGLAPEELPHLFEMFTQVSRHHGGAKGGLGIGLSLARRLMEMHGGSVSAHSEGPGRGSRFTVTLPRLASAAGELPGSGAAGEAWAPNARRRVLVVDDNHDAAESTALLLKALGAQVRVAFGGAAALQLVERWRPELVLLDLGMPEMDGHEVARRLVQQVGAQRPLLVALTGWGQQQDREQTRRAGFDEHVVKPVDLAGLQRLLARVRAR